jgi:hypothetical protein
MSKFKDTKIPTRRERGDGRYAFSICKAFSYEDRFIVFDENDTILGGYDTASFTFDGDPRALHPHLFIESTHGLLMDPIEGADQDYFDRLEELAAHSLDFEHCRRALNIDGERQ